MPVGPGSIELATLPVGAVVVASVVPVIFATILYAILGRFLTRPIRAFWIISVVVFVLTLALPLVNLPATVERSTVIALEVMHIIAEVATVGVLTVYGREQ